MWPGSAGAGTRDEPELVDACGITEQRGLDALREPSPEWADVCAGWFEALQGPDEVPALRVSVAFAGELAGRPTAFSYTVSWGSGDCTFRLVLRDDGAPVLRSAERALLHRCGPASEPTTCNPPQLPLSCVEPTPEVRVPLPAQAVVEDGDVLEVTLVFAGALAPFADEVADGVTLTKLYAIAEGAGVSAVSYCVSGFCGALGADAAYGGAPFVPDRAGAPIVDGPIVPVERSCVDGPLSEASADRPHLTDPVDDHDAALVQMPAPDGDGYNLTAAWFGPSRTGDGVTVNILPVGPADVVGETAYSAVFAGGRLAYAEGLPDGTWAFLYGVQRYAPEGATEPEPVATTGSVDPETGLVQIDVPEDGVPAGDLRFDDVYSSYTYAGSAPRPQPGFTTRASVDGTDDGTICLATRD